MNGLHLALPLQLIRHLRRSNTQHQKNQEDRNHQPHQHEPLLILPSFTHAPAAGAAHMKRRAQAQAMATPSDL
jgi:hypothetical protein